MRPYATSVCRSAGKVELNFTMHRRNLPARERIETDEEVAKREDEDYRQKKMENPDKARAPTHDQVYIYIYILYIYVCMYICMYVIRIYTCSNMKCKS